MKKIQNLVLLRRRALCVEHPTTGQSESFSSQLEGRPLGKKANLQQISTNNRSVFEMYNHHCFKRN